MAESTHRVEIVPVTLEKHPNADSLSIVKIEGYQAVVRTDEWYGCQELFAPADAPLACLGAYIPPDSLVPVDRPEFDFLAPCAKNPFVSAICRRGTLGCPLKHPEKVRVKARRLRGEWSMGLLIHAPVDAKLGDDVATLLGVEHYEPPEPGPNTGGETERPPKIRRKCPSCEGAGFTLDPQDDLPTKCLTCDGKGYPNDAEAVTFDVPKYDVEAFRKYGRHAFEVGEHVWVTEKIHGSNGRWLYDGERFYCGSHKEWKRCSETSLWWRALAECPALENFLFMNPGTVVYGEVYGQVQDLKYGAKPGEIRIAVFDILHEGKWVDASDSQSFQPNPSGPPAWTLPWVPLVASCEFDFDLLLWMADGNSLIPGANHLREGIVIKPIRERWNPKCGRVNLKVISNQYLERA